MAIGKLGDSGPKNRVVNDKSKTKVKLKEQENKSNIQALNYKLLLFISCLA